MGKRGPKKQPAAIVKAKGTYRPSRTPDEVAKSDALDFIYNSLPSPPDQLDEVGAKCWTEILSQAQNVYGYISFIDLKLFAEYCECYSELQDLNNRCRGGARAYKDDNGVIRVNPIYKDREKLRDQFIKLSREFGFSPSARTGISLMPNTDEVLQDEFDEGI